MQSDDLAKLKAYLESKDTKAAMSAAGARSGDKPIYVREGPMTQY